MVSKTISHDGLIWDSVPKKKMLIKQKNTSVLTALLDMKSNILQQTINKI
jgi:hypothetical protein